MLGQWTKARPRADDATGRRVIVHTQEIPGRPAQSLAVIFRVSWDTFSIISVPETSFIYFYIKSNDILTSRNGVRMLSIAESEVLHSRLTLRTRHTWR